VIDVYINDVVTISCFNKLRIPRDNLIGKIKVYFPF
jgi:hypothetical protein